MGKDRSDLYIRTFFIGFFFIFRGCHARQFGKNCIECGLGTETAGIRDGEDAFIAVPQQYFCRLNPLGIDERIEIDAEFIIQNF